VINPTLNVLFKSDTYLDSCNSGQQVGVGGNHCCWHCQRGSAGRGLGGKAGGDRQQYNLKKRRKEGYSWPLSRLGLVQWNSALLKMLTVI